MFKNQFKIAFRNLRKNKTFSLINILGLALGMTCCFLTLLYCWHEFNYDTFHKDGDRIYQVEYRINRGEEIKIARIPSPIGPVLVDNFPEIEAASRFYGRELSIELEETQQQFEIENVFFVDSTALNVFTFDFLHGNPQRALHQPDAVVISDALALKIFGSTNVIGKPLKLASEGGYRVSGVVKEWPDNAHLAFDMLIPYQTVIKAEPPHARERLTHFLANNWGATHSYTYVKLKPNQDPAKVDERFKTFVAEKLPEKMKDSQAFGLIPIQAIHLLEDGGGPKPAGNRSYLYLFFCVGILTLLIACINFVNLSTASSMTRAKEVGVRKVLGARTSSLIGQFLGESLLLSFFAFIVALLLTVFSLPAMNNLTGVEISTATIWQPAILSIFLGIFLLTGFLAGSYPAFFVSRFQPSTVLKGTSSSSNKSWNEWLRKGLITLQFLAAIGFIAGAWTVYLQLQHLQNQPLGFNEELVISLPLNSANNLNAVLRPGDPGMRQRMNSFDESLLTNPNINAVTQCSKLPGDGYVSRHFSNDMHPPEERMIAAVLSIDYDFAEALELEVVAGRDFDVSHGTDHLTGFMLNEKAVGHFGWENAETAVGERINMEGKEGMVLGVIKDFHFQSLHENIDPLVMDVRPGSFGHFALRVNNGNMQETLSFVEEKWKAAFPEKVFQYAFLDETINSTYLVEKRLASMIGYAAFLAIFIACFGLFGLAALLTQQRFKEIGIRKVLGASVTQILKLISKDFLILIGLAILIATPLTWYVLKNWLADFAFQISFPWWVTLVSGLAVMVIAFFTISAQSMKAALSNPVDAIRDE